MAKAGRKPKLTPAMRTQILEAVSKGLSRNRAAILVGCGAATINRECKRNRQFRNALRTAEAACELHHLTRIYNGEKTWQSSAWTLQRKWYKRYGDKPNGDSNSSTLLQMARAMVAASPPPNAIPGVAPSGPVQDDPRRPAVGQDGTIREAPPGPVAAGPVEEPPAVG